MTRFYCLLLIILGASLSIRGEDNRVRMDFLRKWQEQSAQEIMDQEGLCPFDAPKIKNRKRYLDWCEGNIECVAMLLNAEESCQNVVMNTYQASSVSVDIHPTHIDIKAGDKTVQILLDPTKPEEDAQ